MLISLFLHFFFILFSYLHIYLSFCISLSLFLCPFSAYESIYLYFSLYNIEITDKHVILGILFIRNKFGFIRFDSSDSSDFFPPSKIRRFHSKHLYSSAIFFLRKSDSILHVIKMHAFLFFTHLCFVNYMFIF